MHALRYIGDANDIPTVCRESANSNANLHQPETGDGLAADQVGVVSFTDSATVEQGLTKDHSDATHESTG